MGLSDLVRTKIHLAGLEGVVTRREFGYVIETPRVPTFFHGTCLVLEDPPESFDGAVAWHREALGHDVAHRLIVWGGEGAPESVRSAAIDAGFEVDVSTAMAMDSAPAEGDATGVRPLTIEDWDRVEALSIACNASEGEGGDPGYRIFCDGMRALNRAWIESGSVTWWGAFVGDQLVGQCGFAVCDSGVGAGLGRYQAVEVHPGYRRRGIAGRLVRAVARHGFRELGCHRLILEADSEGPAVGLYTRLGFERIEDEHSLLWSRSSIHVRPEGESDFADVRALSRRSHGGDGLADRLAEWRGEPGVCAWVAERNGKVLGHVLTRALKRTLGGAPAEERAGGGADVCVVESLVVRPSAAGSGVEATLLRRVADWSRAERVSLVLLKAEFPGAEALGLRKVDTKDAPVLASAAGDVLHGVVYAQQPPGSEGQGYNLQVENARPSRG